MQKINYIFGNEQLKIVQDDQMFQFSLDSILLPHFARVLDRTKTILDIGSGNAVIPLILSTKTNASIVGVELQKEVYELGKQSIALNHLEDQISFVQGDIRVFATNQESDQFDLITCNPPYFKLSNESKRNENPNKKVARHEETLTIEELIKIARKLLKNQGSLVVVHRPERLVEFLLELKKNNLEPKRIQFVYPKKGKEANILLIEARKQGRPGLQVLEPLYVHEEDGRYSEALFQYMAS